MIFAVTAKEWTVRRMTDSELIKALENKVQGSDYACFEDYEILDLINRQKAEIEKLKGSTIVSNIMESQRIKREAKAEAIKEFAKRLKSSIYINTNLLVYQCEEVESVIDDIVKEMVGDTE